jgi:hypothetical protein
LLETAKADVISGCHTEKSKPTLASRRLAALRR